MEIERMGVGEIHHLIDRVYRESNPLQFLRELCVNSLEAGATRVEFGVEWQGVVATGIYRLLVADNGRGMSEDELVEYMNTFGHGSKKIGGPADNFGIGAKSSLLPANPFGVVIISWHESCPTGAMIWLKRDEASGEYGARIFHTPDGNRSVVAPFFDDELGLDWASVKPSWIGIGTAVILLGASPTDNTFRVAEVLEGSHKIAGIAKNLNFRFWGFAEGVSVRVGQFHRQDIENWPRTPSEAKDIKKYTFRTIEGARYYLERPATGSLRLNDGSKLLWFLGEPVKGATHTYAPERGVVASLYKGELYDLGGSSSKVQQRYRAFGVSVEAVRKILTIVVEPPTFEDDQLFGVYPNSSRSALLTSEGAELPWDVWGGEFMAALPKEVARALQEASTANRPGDDKWRDRLLKEFASRWKAPPECGKPKSTSATFTRTGGIKGPARVASKRSTRDGLPEYEWLSEADIGEDMYAVFAPPSPSREEGVIQLNRDFFLIREVTSFWTGQYPPHDYEQVEAVIKAVYGEVAAARAAHAHVLARANGWTQNQLKSLLGNQEAWTLSVMGLMAEDSVIKRRLTHIRRL